ncbi:hypothetical protein Droror1_Dr00010862 [Drosera rotundifolia]
MVNQIVGDTCGWLMFTLLCMDTLPQPKKRFLLLIDCPGSNLQAGMALYDNLCSLQTPLYTLNMGSAFDEGAYIRAAGMKMQERPGQGVLNCLHRKTDQVSASRREVPNVFRATSVLEEDKL